MPVQAAVETAPLAFEIRGSMSTLFTLHLLTTDLAAVEAQLLVLLAEEPEFFHYAPCVIDARAVPLQDLSGGLLARVVHLLRGHDLVPVGVLDSDDRMPQIARQAGLGVIPISRQPTLLQKHPVSVAERNTVPPPETTAVQAALSEEEDDSLAYGTQAVRIVEGHVRGGQQFYAIGADLIVLGTVSPGAEVLADGNIHVYGRLRGRALAGLGGDTTARIFCYSMEAELVSIAGCFKVLENAIPHERKNRPTQVYLAEEKLIIDSM